MTPLTKQLEDKKKEYKELYNSNHKNFPNSNVCRTCAKMNRCQAEIAILEQAIAEMQKQRQEILDEIGYKIFSEDEQKGNNVWYKKGWDDNASRINKELQQLNQPKTEE